MTIYLKDGYVVSIDNPEEDDSYLTVQYGLHDGYVTVEQICKKRNFTRFSAPRESVLFIDYENESTGAFEPYRPPLKVMKGKTRP